MLNLLLCSLLASTALLSTTYCEDDINNNFNYDNNTLLLEGEEAKEYSNNFGVLDYYDVSYVYVSTNVKEVNNDVEKYFFGNDYYIDSSSIKTTYYKGDLIRSTSYSNLGTATMSVSETYSATFSFDFEIGSDELKLKLGYSWGSSFTVADSYSTIVEAGKPIRISCYQNIEKKTYDVWEDDIWYDDYVGEFYSVRPIGCSFIVYNL